MALAVYDRIQETTATTGTGSVTLAGAVAGYQSFAAVGNGNTTFYCILNGTAWEVGIGTYSTTGPTLARTTVLSNSSGTTSPLTLSGTSNVFVTYPAEKTVNLDASGNVTPLGTIASGTWQGSTIATAYGGTGVTTSTGASSNVLRDANSNVTANNFLAGYNVITAAGTTTVLTTASAYYQRISGSTTQTIQLPNATTMANGQGFTFDNDSSGTVTIVDNASGAVDTIPSGGYGYIFVEDNTTSAGSWGKYALLPASYDFSTTTANFGTATITNATWNGGTIAYNYGGTGLTTFTAANNAIYSTSASALTAGTLPIAAGGTGNTTASAAFNALSPITTAGDLILGNGANSATRLAIGASGTVLTSNGTTASWSTTYAGTVTSVAQSFTGGLISVSGSPVTTSGTLALTVAGTSGGIPYFSSASTWASSAVLAASALMIGGGAGVAPSTTTTGTGVVTALGVNVGTAGAFVVNGGALGTPASGTLTNCSGLPGSGVSGNISGNAANVTGVVALANGGSGQTTAQAAMNAFAGAVTSGSYLRGNGTNVVMSTIQAADVPTLNQNTTGSAGSVTNAVTFNNGGAGAASGTTYNGSAAQTISYNTIGAAPATTYTSTYVPYGQGSTTLNQASNFTFDGTTHAAPVMKATQGFHTNPQTNPSSYTVPASTNAMTAGPFTVATGTTITVSTGSRWVVV